MIVRSGFYDTIYKYRFRGNILVFTEYHLGWEMGSRKGYRTGDYRTGARLATWRGRKTTRPTRGPVWGPIEDGAGRSKMLTPSQSEGGAILRTPAPPRPVTKTRYARCPSQTWCRVLFLPIKVVWKSIDLDVSKLHFEHTTITCMTVLHPSMKDQKGLVTWLVVYYIQESPL